MKYPFEASAIRDGLANKLTQYIRPKIKEKLNTFASNDNFIACVFGTLNQAGDLIKRALGNNGSQEGAPLFGAPDFKFGDLLFEHLGELGPDAFGDIQAGQSATLLAAVFEGGSDRLEDGGANGGRGMDEMKVFSTGFTHYSRVRFQIGCRDALGDVRP
jgi:hypothetical protein